MKLVHGLTFDNIRGDIYGGLMDLDNALERFKIAGTSAVGRRYFNAASTRPPGSDK